MQAQFNMRLQMARQCMQSGQMAQAEALIKQALSQEPDNADAATILATLYIRLQKYDLAIEILDQIYLKNQDDIETLIRIGTIYKNWGKFDKAKSCYRRAIYLEPQSAPHILLGLATTCKYSEYDDDVRLMEDTYKNSDINSTGRRYLAFALGKVFDDLKDYGKAFSYFQEGNRIVASRIDPSMAAAEQTYQLIKDVMGPEFFERHQDAGISDNAPIFVTGMPRSGTTLVEQILASHPNVHGGGELDKVTGLVGEISHTFGHSFPFGYDNLDTEILREKANKYVNGLKTLANKKPHTTDKSIANFVYIGLIKVMLPNAKIILCRRDPRDVGLSIFQLDLGDTYLWTYQLDWIGKYYCLFDDLMGHWNKCLPGQIYTIQYENLVTEPELHIRALLEHCGLEFNQSCLEFHTTDREVTTASRAQVRKPIYKGSAGRWKNYKDHLGPLISALGTDPA